MSAKILVCYLVAPGEQYAAKAVEFADSYAYHDPGEDHDLLIVLRNDPDREADSPTYWPWAANISAVPHFNSGGQDIDSLLQVARNQAREYDYLVWFGSNCHILSHNWLTYFHEAMRPYGVGAAAATGSFEAGVSGETPNPHLRTPCFMTRPETLDAVARRITSRQDCYEFEHGRSSFYRSLKQHGLVGVVVGRDGRTFWQQDWEASMTYRRGEQHNLLIADKQTDAYLAANHDERLALARMAGWMEP